MNAFTKVSEKGQVVVPKVARDRLGWLPGTELEVIESGDAITLRRRRLGGALKASDAVARLRAIYQHQGPPVPVEQLSWSADFDDS